MEMLLIIAEADARTSFASGLTSYNAYRALLNTGYSIGEKIMVTKASLLDTILFNTDFLAGGENSSTNLTSQNALLREI
jgi:hypothetical protein